MKNFLYHCKSQIKVFRPSSLRKQMCGARSLYLRILRSVHLLPELSSVVLKITLMLICLILSWKVRTANYDVVPTQGQSLDEYSYSWLGMSLVEMGYPVGISGIDGYKVNDLRYVNVDRIYQKSTGVGTPVTINYPWFDHPPLMGLVTGGWAYAKGARVFDEASAFLIRKPMIYLGVLSVGLLFVLGYLTLGYIPGLVAAFVYASSPLIIISSRMIQAENGMIPMMLTSLIFLTLYLKNRGIGWLLASAVAAGVATLFKLSGISVALGVLVVLFSERKSWKEYVTEAVFFGVIYGSIVSLFVIYGWVYDLELFKTIFATNSGRFYGIGAAALYNLFTQTKVTGNKYLTDAWPLIGLISFGALLLKSKMTGGEKVIAAGGVAYLAIYLFFGSESYGWYTLPLWPFVVLAFGWVVSRAWIKSERVIMPILLALIAIGLNLTKLVDYVEFQKYASLWKTGMLVGLLVLLALKLNKTNKYAIVVARAFLVLILVIAVYLNIRFAGLMNVDYWYKVN